MKYALLVLDADGKPLGFIPHSFNLASMMQICDAPLHVVPLGDALIVGEGHHNGHVLEYAREGFLVMHLEI